LRPKKKTRKIPLRAQNSAQWKTGFVCLLNTPASKGAKRRFTYSYENLFLFLFKDGSTPLFKACHKGHVRVVDHLLNHHIKPELGLLKVNTLILFRLYTVHPRSAVGHHQCQHFV
jgi:hypothetical protein